VVSLPGAFHGGVLCVEHGGPRVKFDWGTPHSFYQESGLIPSSEIKWAFLYGDCKHSVKKVENGDRLTIAYDVFTIPDLPRTVPESQAQTDAIFHALPQAIADHQGFAKDGCTLAFGLSHSYPPTTEPFGMDSNLDSRDQMLFFYKQFDDVAWITHTKRLFSWDSQRVPMLSNTEMVMRGISLIQ
jgi:hypothetical protein